MTPFEWMVGAGAAVAIVSAALAGASWLVRAALQPVRTALNSESKAREEGLKSLDDAIKSTIGHKVANTASRVDALERLRTSDVERIVKLETVQTAIKEGQTRIEHALDTMKAEQASARAEIVDTIREISRRELK